MSTATDREAGVRARRLEVALASGESDVVAAQRLRYRVFAGELGARLVSGRSGLDADGFDPYCAHLLVRDTATGEVVGCTRILTDRQAARAGGFYSAGEFDLGNVLLGHGRILEIGRTCVAPEYRTGGTIAVLWSGLADYVARHRFDYLMGCTSIDLRDGGARLHAIMNRLRARHLAPEPLRVRPLTPVPGPGGPPNVDAVMPPLLKAYLRLGAWIGGEPCLDREFNVADVFTILDLQRLRLPYARHFLHRAGRGRSGCDAPAA